MSRRRRSRGWFALLSLVGACSAGKALAPADAALAPADAALPRADGPAGASAGPSDAAPAEAPPATGTRVLVFSRTVAFRHDSIPDGIRALEALAKARGWAVTASEDPAVFTEARLAATDVVVFLLTSGDIVGPAEERALEAFVARGGGVVGVHSATDTEYDWPAWQELFGAAFLRHPPGTPMATLTVRDEAHPATRGLPRTFSRADEWYTFRADPARDGATRVLLTVDEDSYGAPPDVRMGHHPVSWSRLVRGGRAFQTALGHTKESYTEPLFLAHLAGGIAWAAGARDPSVVLEELDGTNPVGAWDPHGPLRDFPYEARKDALVMTDATFVNQHLTRRGFAIAGNRPYSIDTLFTIGPDRPGAGVGFNSFCLNFNVQGAGGSAEDLGALNAHAINLDVVDGGAPSGVMKYMGFVGGAFREIGSRRTACCRAGVEYRLRVDVNAGEDGAAKPGLVTVTLSEGPQIHERFTVDYAPFPWQPDRTKPVRVGANTHGANWVMRHLRVRTLD